MIWKVLLISGTAGTNHPQLHHSDYDFPDEIIQTGASMFYGLAEHLCK